MCYNFECIHCGNCCRFLDVYLEKEDILKWIRVGKVKLIQFINIKPETIDADFFIKAEMEGKSEEIKSFIMKQHNQIKNDLTPKNSLVNLRMFIPELKGGCILRPNTLETILKGIELGIKYVISLQNNGDCIFLEDQRCAIHEIKPLICIRFPFKPDNTLAVNDWTLTICKGIKQNKSK